MPTLTEYLFSATETAGGEPPIPQMRELAESLLARRHAARDMRATSLVHEAWLKLARGGAIPLNNEAHFLACASRAMRFVLVDRARARLAAKRAGGARPLEDGLAEGAVMPSDERILAVDAALVKLNNRNSRQAEIVELKFFGGLEVAEVARTMGISPATVKREWAAAKEWLYQEISAAG